VLGKLFATVLVALGLTIVPLSTAPADAAGCFSSPSSCGYPDATNSGVPAGTALTSAGNVTLSAGQTMNARDVTGTVTVSGPNVTIENSKIHTPDGGSGETAIVLEDGADNFKLVDSEVYGNGSQTDAPESGVWNHYNNAGAQVIGSYIHGSPDNWEGRVDLVQDSFMIVDATYEEAHSENIYLCGSTAIVQHSTLYNESDETSLIFGDGICGRGNTVSVADSMLAGGGYMLEPNAKGVSAPVSIVSNRIGRCLSAPSQDSGGGYVCAGGTDSNGYWPRGGHYGLSADLGDEAAWAGNVWDDNGEPVCANGHAGCGRPLSLRVSLDALLRALGLAGLLEQLAAPTAAPVTAQDSAASAARRRSGKRARRRSGRIRRIAVAKSRIAAGKPTRNATR
jgi:hypothetical protein